MPWQGPVAYQVHCGSFTDAVISRGSLQDWPSSVLWVTQTVRGALPSQIMVSSPSARFLQKGRKMAPVSRSVTGQGLPQVMPGSVTTTWTGVQVRPLS